MPPFTPLAGLGFTCFLESITPSTRTRPATRSTSSTRPVLPLSRPAMTFTRSFFLIRIFSGSGATLCRFAKRDGMSDHLRSERHNLHEALVAQFPGHRAEDARADRLVQVVDEHGGVGVEPDVGPILAAGLLAHPDDHALHDLA